MAASSLVVVLIILAVLVGATLLITREKYAASMSCPAPNQACTITSPEAIYAADSSACCGPASPIGGRNCSFRAQPDGSIQRMMMFPDGVQCKEPYAATGIQQCKLPADAGSDDGMGYCGTVHPVTGMRTCSFDYNGQNTQFNFHPSVLTCF